MLIMILMMMAVVMLVVVVVIALFIVAGLCVVICCDHDAHSCRVAAVNDSYGAATDFCVSPVLLTVLETCPKRTRWLSC